MRALCWGLILAAGLPCTVLQGQADSARAGVSRPPASEAASEPPAKPPAMITGGDLLKLAAVGALTGLAYQVDGPVRDWSRRGPATGNDAFRVLEQSGDILVYGAVLGAGSAWVGGMMTDNPTVATTGLRALEAISVATAVTKFAKGIAGRARPELPPHDPDNFKLGRGFGEIDGAYESFPSGHATILFAFASAVTSEVARRAPEHTRVVAVTTYGLGILTAYARLSSDEHWLSDVTLGAGLGMVTGWAVTRWHASRPDNWVDRVFLRPIIAAGPAGQARFGVAIDTR